MAIGLAGILMHSLTIAHQQGPQVTEAIFGVTQVMRMSRNLMFLLSTAGMTWAAINFMLEKDYTKQALGSVVCFLFATITSLMFSVAQAEAAPLDTILGR